MSALAGLGFLSSRPYAFLAAAPLAFLAAAPRPVYAPDN